MGIKTYIKLASALILPILLIPLMLIMLITGDDDTVSMPSNNIETASSISVSSDVERYRPLFEKYAKKYGLETQINILMALTMQESGGRVPDVMQSSESLGLAPNSITDPEQSIDAGCNHFKSVLTKAKGDVDLTLQSYNFGGGFISWVQDGRGGKYTPLLAKQFSVVMASKMGWNNYGDAEYVQHVRRYLVATSANVASSKQMDVIMKEALKYQGQPYVWGGNTANSGFDCSGLTQWCYKQANVSLPRTAEEQYNVATKITESQAKAGDLVFFSGTYAGKFITHVGIYVGNGRMYNSNDSGVEYSSLSNAYWKAHFVGFGRILK
ncbi:bifunctional lytic transglycosylase/C40 family peptidase [Listeria rustica]|uniref:Transglycosylase SLT domain-containing protein n=1 Tax=Listeria rustica TaxID=2713503 RepID=A0A7W1T4X0_9LIST|nr:bifunctional lytic transglycosylase/C40 family peptidase [Listeria rustica]MBA3925538.1 transglycosylase SLT domain-containing protein [Listeria rustica]